MSDLLALFEHDTDDTPGGGDARPRDGSHSGRRDRFDGVGRADGAGRADGFGQRPSGVLAPSLLAAVATLVAMWPYTAVITAGVWSFVVVVVICVVAVAGIIGRLLFARLRGSIRHLATLVLQLIAATAACTSLLASETALLGLIPTPTSLRLIELRLAQSVDEIANGVAPVAASLPLATALGLAFAVVAIIVDHLLARRMVLLAVLLTSVVGAVPMLISFSSVNIAWFLMQAVMILVVLRHGTRRDPQAPRDASFLLAGGTGIVAILITLVAAPALPLSSPLPGNGPMLTVNANLRLGDDLRRPEGIEALTLVTSAATPPYLRIATLSRFDGDVWRPDRSDQVPLRDGFGDLDWAASIKTVEQDVSIRVLGVSSDRLPLPYAAESISGVDGDWSAVPLSRTAISRTADAAGADYTVKTATASPTLEQIRATSASGQPVMALPNGVPPVVAQLAREVTADANTDYDRLLALQNWFRSDFSYSLDAPVEEGFDGTGAEAVATFLDKRTGYCIHFAGAFALMAQALDMPVRIVVGYLPGTSTDEKRGDDTVYSVSSDQLHSWPEVYFDGIGWVPFEPTATLGEPTDFVAESTGGSGDGPDAPTPTIAPSAGPSAAPTSEVDPRLDADGGGQALQRLDPTPVVLVAFGILLLLLLPALVRELRRMRRMRRAHAGDAMAAWRELTDSMADLGLGVDDAQTARTRADALVRRGAAPAALSVLVDAVEHRSYAKSAADAGDLATPLRVVLTQLAARSDRLQRVLARVLPASLFRRRP
ncbi:Transglutaminase-like enzymes, putative cysteine proteases [Microbacterium esteraromaticum]|uniref:Transglutaminase-like enzymes, putative cysteine proteases n=1 Tax=Microbacterium esteraromaticum TaxID=57043 RepID=A0A1R4I855_9MICO|nr:DUF3488 and transglutaminase-like domain-containing protein [Microbacterium esteraromaticum]SJN16051.1 Transglutaminase-like enzymes, putative cysteine proteases [Microbacterium esteraromaticum]